MTPDKVAIQALFNVLYLEAGPGLAVVELDRRGKTERYVDRHALDVSGPKDWTKAVWTAVTFDIPMRVRPLLYTYAVRSGVGTSAHNVSKGTHLRGMQRTVQVRWLGVPAPDVVAAFAAVGGHIVEGTRERIGLLPVRRCSLSELLTLQTETATVFGAIPSEAPLTIVNGRGLDFVTDVAAALTGEPATSEAIVRAGLCASLDGSPT